ncbi:MAG: class I SAM-dependent methyltransferase [bacterium]|nr:class I SAM-dependent methyltransferase [bacterium]
MARRDDKAPLDGRTRELLGAYRAELLRWNQQINLLSRRDAEGTADTLIRQCLDAFEMWWLASGAELAAGGTLRLFDLGSGGGLPAFVWLAQLTSRGVATRATLVEPRAKRAWFLERLTHLPGAPAFEVVASRWGDRLAFGSFGPETPPADAAAPWSPSCSHSRPCGCPKTPFWTGWATRNRWRGWPWAPPSNWSASSRVVA